jgi:hypothetical protein
VQQAGDLDGMRHEGHGVVVARLAGVPVRGERQGVARQRRPLDEVGSRHQVINIESAHGPSALYISVAVHPRAPGELPICPVDPTETGSLVPVNRK